MMAILFGTFWGTLVFCMDRFFVASMRKFKDNFLRGAAMAVLRMLLAAMIGFTVSKPLELEIFRPEIELQLAEDAARDRADRERTVTAGFTHIPELENELKQLKDEIAAREKKSDSAYQEVKGEIEGTLGTYIPGHGSAYLEKQAHFEQEKDEFESIKKQNNALTKQIEAKLAEERASRDAAVAVVTSTERRGHGILARMRALDEIAADPKSGTTLPVALSMISWLFVLLEITPVLAKAAMTYGPYDSIIESRETAVILQSSDLTATLTRSLEQQSAHDARLHGRALSFEEDAFEDMLGDVRGSAAFADGQQDLAMGFLARLKDRLARFVHSS